MQALFILETMFIFLVPAVHKNLEMILRLAFFCGSYTLGSHCHQTAIMNPVPFSRSVTVSSIPIKL